MNKKEKAIKKALNKRQAEQTGWGWTKRKHRDIPLEQVSETILPDDHKFEGSIPVDGKFCNTAGEYKEALRKSDKLMGGWGG